MENTNYKTLHEFEKSMRQPSRPQVSAKYTGNRNLYDDIEKRKKYKESVFQGKATTTDFITGETLHANRQMALNKYGVDRANYHTGQVDHIVPLEQAHSMAKEVPFLDDADIRAAANSEWNYRFTQSHFNQSKQSKSNFEMAAQSLQEGKYEESARLMGDGIVAYTGVGTELGVRASKNAGEYAIKKSYQTLHDTAKSVSPKLTVEAERRLMQSAKELRKNVGEDLRSAAIPLTIATVNALVSVAKDEKSLRDAGQEVVLQAGTAVAATEVQRIGIHAANQALKKSGVQVLKQVANANIVAHAVTIGFMVKDSVVMWLDGNLNDEEFVQNVCRTGTMLAAETMGAMIGQAVIPIPYAGAVIGSVIASIACGCIFSLTDAAKNHIAKDKRNLVSKIAADALQELNHQREILQQYLADENLNFDRNVSQGFEAIIAGTYKNDAEVIAYGLNTILGNFDKNVAFATEEEFDEFFMDENAVLKL